MLFVQFYVLLFLLLVFEKCLVKGSILSCARSIKENKYENGPLRNRQFPLNGRTKAKFDLPCEKKEDIMDAISCYSEAIKEEPSNSLYFELRGTNYLRLKNFQKAIDDLATALQLNPSCEENVYNFMEAVIEYGTLNESIRETLKLLNYNKLFEFGCEFYKRNKFEEAVFIYSVAIMKNRGESAGYGERAKCFLKMKNFRMAILDFEKLMRMEILKLDDWINFSESLVKAGQYREAQKIIKRIESEVSSQSSERVGRISQEANEKEKERLEKLLDFSKKLILDDEERLVHEIDRKKIPYKEWREEVDKLKSKRDLHIQELTSAFNKYEQSASKINDGQTETSSVAGFDKIILDFTRTMTDPVVTPSGNTYERLSLLIHLEKYGKKDPATGEDLSEYQLIPNKILKQAINEWKRIN